VTYTGSLTSFEPGGLSLTLSSSSNVIGQSNAVLSITVDPETYMVADGTLVVMFPEYYKDSGSDQMIGVTSPSCSADGFDIENCVFNSASRSLTIVYQTVSGSSFSDARTFLIRNFKNPVTPDEKIGFSALSTD